jgi:hypothetical protein
MRISKKETIVQTYSLTDLSLDEVKILFAAVADSSYVSISSMLKDKNLSLEKTLLDYTGVNTFDNLYATFKDELKNAN